MRLFRSVAVLLVLLSVAAPGLEAAKKLPGEGEGLFRAIDLKGLPNFALQNDLSGKERSYLGLADDGPFTLREVGAELVLVEFLNVYCYACVMQAPIMNEAHRLVQARENLRDRVRFLGIAIGNGPEETARFHGQFDIPYPVIPDPEFKALDAIGNPGGTPFLVIYPMDESVPRAHLGLMRDAAELVAQIEAALAAEEPPAAAPEFRLTTWRNLDSGLSPEELENRLRESAAAANFKAVRVTAVDVEGERNIFRLEAADGTGLWAKVAGRAKVCNICHDIFFILLFDDTGRIVNFTPIHVTKYENVPIDEKEAAFMRGRLEGRSITDPPAFDHEVDAISQATMSSELIFDTVRRLQAVFGSLQRPGRTGTE
jgi:hypothetical protein